MTGCLQPKAGCWRESVANGPCLTDFQFTIGETNDQETSVQQANASNCSSIRVESPVGTDEKRTQLTRSSTSAGREPLASRFRAAVFLNQVEHRKFVRAGGLTEAASRAHTERCPAGPANQDCAVSV